jgi:hypothetical protein
MFDNRSTPPTKVELAQSLGATFEFMSLVEVNDRDPSPFLNENVPWMKIDVKDLVIDK